MPEEKQKDLNYQLVDDVADQLGKLGLAVPVWDRPVTPEEIHYFLDRWPFLQILSGNEVDAFDEVERVTARRSGWTILNYGDAITTSPGAFLFGGGDFTIHLDGDGGEGGDIVNPGKGTVWRQAYLTTQEMVSLAQSLGWQSVHVVDGHPLMKWAAWMHTMDNDMGITGFEPSEKDQKRRERVRRSEIEDEKRFIASRPRI